MDICLITRYFDLKYGGIGRVSTNIKVGLEQRGHSIYGIEQSNEGVFNYLKYSLYELRKRIPKGKDIYHALTPIESLWIPRSRSVVTVHDLILLRDRDYMGSGVGRSKIKAELATHYFSICLQGASKCSRLVFVSEATKNNYLHYYPGTDLSRIKVIKSGINSDLDYSEWHRKEVRDKLRLGYLGQLDKRKRISELIYSFQRQCSVTDMELWVAGTGVDKEIVEEQCKDSKNIVLWGFIPDNTIKGFYNSIDFFIFPSIAEGYGLPLVEAMACKTPPVVFRDADIPEEVKSRCIVLDSFEDLPKLRDTKLSKEQIEDNYNFAKTHKWEKVIDEYELVYKEVIQNS